MPLVSPADAHRRAEAAERRARERLRPPPLLTYREWADRYRVLAGATSEKGRWRTDRVPHIAEILDALSDPRVQEVTVMKCSQAAGTEGLILNMIGYHIDLDPAPILVIIPSVDEAEKWSKKKLKPMLDATPRLRNKVADQKSRSSSNTILEKSYAGGGTIGIVGSNSGRGFRMVSARIVGGDDVDAWDASAGTEGDQITLARRRADRFADRKLLWVSTPLLEETSRIWSLYRSMDSRGRFHVPCPHCGHYQVLRWGGPDKPYGIKWERKGERHLPETAAYLCEACATLIDERYKHEMATRGRYLTDDGQPLERAPTMGFWFNALSVLLVGSEWPKLVEEFLRVHDDPVKLQGFVNAVLAEPWVEKNEEVSAESLEARRETYAAEVPAGVGVLTASADVQDDRIEVQVQGWGEGEEWWLITHQRLYGDPEQPDVWSEVERILTRPYRHESGLDIHVRAAAIDAGFLAPHVYRFVRGKEIRGVYAMKGGDERAREPLKRATRRNQAGVKPWTVNTIHFKDMLFRRIRRRRPGPGYMHFCLQERDGADAEYFAQFGAEKPITERSGGKLVRRYKQIRPRNEAIDLYVYGLAALHTLPRGVRDDLGGEARRLKEEAERVQQDATKPGDAPVVQKNERTQPVTNPWAYAWRQ